MALYTHTHTHTHTPIFKRERGITLIALVITIIVLLILAGVSINAVIGENGIATKAKQASEQTSIGTEKEQLNVSFASCQMENSDETGEDALVTASQLQTEMNNSYGSGTVEVTGTESILTVKYLDSEREYLITQNGVVINYEEAKASSTDGAIGIAEDGSIVDMSLWAYEYSEPNNYDSSDGYAIVESNGYFAGYRGTIENGRIQGKIPMYILGVDNGTNPTEFKEVKSLYCTFKNLDTLIYAPEIPRSVKEMNCTFYGCSNLVVAPEIPCSVTRMDACFLGCSALTGILEINANSSEYNRMLENVATNEGCELVLTGSSTMLEEILATKSDTSNITIAE